MSKPWIFVSPSTRGIGYALTPHLLQKTSLPILATARLRHDPEDVKKSLLQGLPEKDALAKRLSIVHADVTDDKSLSDAASRAAEMFPTDKNHLRLACAIPGILRPEKNPSQIDADASLEQFRINTVGPLLLIKHFDQFLPRRTTKLDYHFDPRTNVIDVHIAKLRRKFEELGHGELIETVRGAGYRLRQGH